MECLVECLISNANEERMRECLFTSYLKVRRSRLFSGRYLIYGFWLLRCPRLSRWIVSALRFILMVCLVRAFMKVSIFTNINGHVEILFSFFFRSLMTEEGDFSNSECLSSQAFSSFSQGKQLI